MGRYYALNDGEPADVAAACAEHYQPRFAGDALPSSGVPTAVALADKLENAGRPVWHRADADRGQRIRLRCGGMRWVFVFWLSRN